MSKCYILKVSRAEDVALESRFGPLGSQVPSLYVEIGLGKTIQKTNTIKDNIAPTWDESLPLVCKNEPPSVSVKLKHRSKLKDKTIGRVEVELAKLLTDCKEGEIKLRLSVDGQPNSVPTATVVVRLIASDSKAVAELALHNLVRDITEATAVVHLIVPQSKAVAQAVTGLIPQNLVREISKNPQSGSTIAEKVVDKVDRFVEEGKSAIGKSTDLFDAFKDTIPAIDRFVNTIDDIADAHPYLKLAWYTASALYRIVSAQVKADERFIKLVKTLVKLFNFVKDTKYLRDILPSLQSTISDLLDVITECCLLMRKHARHSFASRSLNAGDRAKINELEISLTGLRTELSVGFGLQTNKIVDYTKKQVEVMKLFQTLNLSPREDTDAFNRPRCLPGTRTAIQQQIVDWAYSESTSNIFWLSGVAGSGKSTVATSIAEHFRKKSQLGAHLFFTRDKSNPGCVIPDLAYTLASSNPCFAAHLPSVFPSGATAENFFEELIQNPLTSCASEVAGPVIIILDALDECGTPSSRHELMLLLLNKIAKLSSKFRFLITSRPELDIKNAFSSFQHVDPVELDSSSPDSERDVYTYLSVALPKAMTEPAPKGWKWKEVIDDLARRAKGLFIWASTVIKFIGDKKTYQFRRLKELLSNPQSHTPEGLYATVLRNSLDWDEMTASNFSKVFALVLFGKKQLSDVEIDGLLNLPSDEGSSIILSKLQSVIAYEPGKPIRLHHASFSDYLTSSTLCSHPWLIDSDFQKQMIVERCFDVMVSSLRFNICNLKTAFVRNKDITDIDDRIKKNIPPHLVYACQYWAQHLCDVPYSDNLLERLTTFAYEHLLHWLEVLSLTENFFHQSGQALQDAIEWIGDKESELSGFLRQAINLASIFAAPIAESAPHIYVSMITLTEKDSVVSLHYSPKLPSLSRVVVERKGIKPVSTILKMFKGHAGYVNSVGFSPNGKHVVSGSHDNTVLVWDVESGAVVAGPFKGHTDCVNSVGFSPDGKRVVSGSEDNTVLVWDIESGAVVAGPFKGHTEEVTSVGFSPDGKRIVSGSSDKTVVVWDIESGAIFAGPFKKHTSGVTSVGFSPDGKRVVSGSYNNTILVWDIESGVVVAGPFKEHTSKITSVGFSPDGKRIVSGSSDKTVVVWDVKSGAIFAGPFKGHTHWVTSVGFSHDGKRVVSGSYDNTVLVWNVESGAVVAGPFKEHTEGVTSVGFSPDSKRVVSGSLDKTVLMWNVESGVVVADPFKGHTGKVTSVGFSYDGKRVVSGSLDNTVLVWDVESGTVVAGPFKMHTKGVISVGFSPDGKRVVSGSLDDTVLVWDVESGTVVSGPFKANRRSFLLTSVWFSPDGKRVISRGWLSSVLVWDVDSGQRITGPANELTSGPLYQVGRYKVTNHYERGIRVAFVDNADSNAQSPDDFSSWTLSNDSWIRSQDGKLLLWIPPDISPTLWLPHDISVFNCQFSTRLDFKNYDLEGKWYNDAK